MGSERGVEARGSSIRITFKFQGRRRRETLKIPPTAKNLKYAEGKRAQILYEIEIGTFDYGKHFPDSPLAKLGRSRNDFTVSQGVDLWLRTRMHTEATRTRYNRLIAKNITPTIGPQPMRAVLPSELQAFKVALARKLRPKTINNILIVVRGAFETAHADGIIQSNPAARLKNVENPRTTDADPFTPDELRLMMAAFEEQQADMIDFWWNTGLRHGELYGLQWADIDWKACTAHIQRATVEGREELTKTKRERFVQLGPRAMAVLQRQRPRTQLHSEFVFLNPDTGAPWFHPVTLYRKWKRACARQKVRFRPPKQLRHTYASMALSSGEPPLFVMNQLGHTSLTMLERHYAKWMPRANTTAGKGFEAIAGTV